MLSTQNDCLCQKTTVDNRQLDTEQHQKHYNQTNEKQHADPQSTFAIRKNLLLAEISLGGSLLDSKKD